MPESRTQEINSSLVVYSGALSAGSASILPSETISTTGAVAPVGSCSVATLATVPEMLAWIGEPRPSTWPINVPTYTWSPSLTTGLAGAPMCIFSGMSTRSGDVMDVQAKSRISLHWGGCTPPLVLCRENIGFPSISPPTMRGRAKHGRGA